MYTNPISRPEDYYPVTSVEVDQVAQEMNIEIPPFLKEFFIQYNGANLQYKCHNGQPIITWVLILSPTMDHPQPDLSVKAAILVNRENDENPRPDYLIPFALDPTGSGVYVSTHPEDLGSVYISYWEHDELDLLSTDFVSFINNLQPFTPPNK